MNLTDNFLDRISAQNMIASEKSHAISADTCIGHVHLKVADLERALKFYTDALGFELTARMGKSAAFLAAGGYHHHIGLNTWESAGGSPPPQGATGLFHFAILAPTRKDLALAIKRLTNYGWPIDGASDHGVSEAIYLRDPDDNGIEIYADRPRDQWPRDQSGNVVMITEPLDVDSVMAELEK
jgi:catechol 2,3-dioxygenase